MDSKAGLEPAATADGEAASAGPAHQRGRRYGERFAVTAAPLPAGAVAPGSEAVNPLEAYFDAHREGPGIWKWRHYFEIYHRHFAKFVGREVNVLEIGVYSGGSLGLWQHYFGPKCRIWGVDILEQCKAFETDAARVMLGDQGDRAFWQRFRQDVPVIDIVIDDGSHFPEHQMVTMEEMLPHVRSGGVYLCEDVYGNRHSFHDFVNGLSNQLNEFGKPLPGVADFHNGMAPNAVQRDVHSVHHYPFVTVIEKAPAPVWGFTAPRHGSQWLKFG